MRGERGEEKRKERRDIKLWRNAGREEGEEDVVKRCGAEADGG